MTVLILLTFQILLILNYNLRRFKFVKTLVLMLKKIESDDKQNMTHFIQTQPQRQLSIKMPLMMYLNGSILQLHQTNKNIWEEVYVRLLVQS